MLMLMEATTKCSTVTSVDIKLVTLTLTLCSACLVVLDAGIT
jgi:hypothetical protein